MTLNGAIVSGLSALKVYGKNCFKHWVEHFKSSPLMLNPLLKG
ncbi:MAG: hypothetical protein QW542_07415 [Thermoproteota archaeon]